MKRYFVLFILLFTCLVTAQEVPSIFTKVILPLQYSEKDIQEWERYRNIIYYKLGEGGILSPEDQKFEEEFEKKQKENNLNTRFGEEDFLELECSPWEIDPPWCSWYCGAVYKAEVSSYLSPKGKNVYSGESIWDNDTRTAWVEGVKGYGIGEYVEFVFPYYAPRASVVFIANGYNKNETIWRNNSRVKTFNLYEDDQLTAIIHLKDTRDLQSFDLPHPFPNRPDGVIGNMYDEKSENFSHPVKLKFVITEVYKGDKYEDTAISELRFDGLDVHCLAEGTLIKMSDRSEKKVEDVRVGDYILVYDREGDFFRSENVTKIYEVTHTQLVKLTLKVPSGSMKIITTDDHPFLSDEGWKSYNPQKTKNYKRYSSLPVKKYEVGDRLKFYTGESLVPVLIESIEVVPVSMKTYTLETDGDGAFIANGLIAGQE